MAPFRWRSVVLIVIALAAMMGFAGPASAQETRPQGIGPSPPAPTSIVVNLPARTLYWYVNGELVRSFPVAIGKTSTVTPVGAYKVQYKAVHPWWQPPDGGPVVPPGPSNPLGTRWIQFNGGYGIHGNNNPSSIGQVVSAGCIRMYKEDVEWLYEQVSVGTPVHIIYETVQVQNGPGGRRYLAVYPDVYGRGTANVGHVLKAAGFEPDAVAVSGPGLYPLSAQALVNGHALETVLHQGKAYVAARKLGDRMSAAVGWDPESRTVSLDGQAVPTVVRGSTGYVDAATAAAVLGVEYNWNAQTGTARFSGQPLFLNGRLLSRQGQSLDGVLHLPVRLVGEAVGATIGWNPEQRQALVSGQPVQTWLRGSTSYTPAAALADRLGLRLVFQGDAIYLTR